MDADVFSQPIGYVPQFPLPPKYIKMRSHGKKEKDFNRVFLAQELKGRSGVEIAQDGGRRVQGPVPKIDSRKDGNAIWAMEFSKDGKHLAAGGKDFIVRVWTVLSNKEDRQTHEAEEETMGHEGQHLRLHAPVFKRKTVREYSGHTASILDLSWSKNNFLLSSSMDKTVRLWHVSREECLCCFNHSDFVTSIQFHPRDDRFFLAGALDSKLRLWSIPDKNIAYINTIPDLITAVAFTPDGKVAIAGCLNGLCLFYETEGLKYQTQLHVRSAHGKNAKGSKITGIQAINYPPEDQSGEVKVLVTSNDSRVRIYNLRDKGLELKLKGNENSCSQIRATFSDDAKYVICGSEDRKAYIWSTGPAESEKDKRPVEMFEAHQAIVTTAIMAPTRTRQLLSASGDPLYDLCNPPPVKLVSRAQSYASSIPPTEDGKRIEESIPPAPATVESTKATKPEESPAYVSRCKHPDGNIMVTADFNGNIKVFRQDCAFQNRIRNNDSALTKKMLGRTNSVATRNSTRSSRTSLQLNHSSDRILSWRQSINNNNNSTNGSFDSFRRDSNGNTKHRSTSPRKPLSQIAAHSPARLQGQASLSQPNSSAHHSPPGASVAGSATNTKEGPAVTKTPTAAFTTMPNEHRDSDPLMLQGDQSWMFWNKSVYKAQAAHPSHLEAPRSGYSSQAESSNGSLTSGGGHDGIHLGVPVARDITNVSVLSSEENSEAGSTSEPGGGELKCRKCAETSFRVKMEGVGKQTLVCNACGTAS